MRVGVCSRPAEFVRLSCMFVHGEVCLASRTLSPFTLTGSCRDLTASAADIEPTLERWREMPDTGSSLEFHSLLSVELVPDCLARKQRGMLVLRRPQMMKMLRFLSFRIMLKFYKLATCNLSSGPQFSSLHEIMYFYCRPWED